MPQPQSGAVTVLLAQARAGDSSALESIYPIVYNELHELASRQLRREQDGHTLSPTALLHEAYIRLIDYRHIDWQDRAHFLAIASTAMRRVLVDHARSHRSLKRGGELQRVPLESADAIAESPAAMIVALDDALDRLRGLDERQARVVEYRFFGGMTEEETAAVLGIGLRTVKRDWAKARSWLYRELSTA
jgi:RNA polymerase sigma-70 factor, ECF subfamily